MIDQIINEGSRLAQKKNRTLNNSVGKVIQRETNNILKFDNTTK